MILQSKLDDNIYTYSTLNNGLRSLQIKNPIFDKSACALSVSVGSFDEHIPGLAHFLEHMLFMGTEKFPGENDFMEFLSNHNGSSNAFTCNEMTTYYFEIEPKYFKEALDRFSHFFKTPLLKESCVDREKNAVDSEFKNVMRQDNWRKWRMANVSSIEKYNKFTCGNNKTLDIENIKDIVKDFWQKTYSSQKMCLTIAHHEDIVDTTNVFFSGIKKFNSDVRNISENFKVHVFDPEFCNKILHIDPVADIKELDISIEVPHKYLGFKNNFYGYLSFLLEREGENSLICILKSKQYIFDLSLSFDETFSYTTFNIQISLTNTGLENYLEIRNIVAAYLKSLVFKEDDYIKLKNIRNKEFKYLENHNTCDLVVDLCCLMQTYPIENILNNEFIFDSFDLKEFTEKLEIIANTQNWLTFLLNKKSFENTNDYSIEEYFNIRYYIEECKEQPSICNVYEDVHETGTFKFIYENRYLSPKVDLNFIINMPITEDNYTKLLFYFNLVDQEFISKFDDFLTFSSISYNFRFIDNGVEVNFYGFTDKIIEAVEKYFICFNDLKEKHFTVIKNTLYDENLIFLNNPPFKHVVDRLRTNFLRNKPNSDKILTQIQKMKFEDIPVALKFNLGLFAVGNDTHYAYKDVFVKLKDKFATESKYIAKIDFTNREVKFSVPDKVNNCVAIFIKSHVQSDLVTTARLETIISMCGEAFFDQLRTKDALGYVVYCRHLLINDTSFYNFTVQSEKGVIFLEERIEQFIKEYNDRLCNLTDDDFEMMKENAISSVMEKEMNLKDYADFLKGLYYSDIDGCGYKEKLKDVIGDLKKDSLILGDDKFIVKCGNK